MALLIAGAMFCASDLLLADDGDLEVLFVLDGFELAVVDRHRDADLGSRHHIHRRFVFVEYLEQPRQKAVRHQHAQRLEFALLLGFAPVPRHGDLPCCWSYR